MSVSIVRCRFGAPAGTGSRGFSLLEVVIASSIVLISVTAVTAYLTAASRTEGRMAAAMQADRALASTVEHLRLLPYCATRLPDSSLPTGTLASDLVAAVFPHALSWRSLPDARFVAVDEDGVEAGSFVSRLGEGSEVICVARYRNAGGHLLEPAELSGFDVRSSSSPPAPELDLTLLATVAGHLRTYHLVCRSGSHALVDTEGAP